jgi:hypothetical protein
MRIPFSVTQTCQEQFVKGRARNMSILALLALLVFCFQSLDAMAQGTAFTYQGQLASGGVPAGGIYNLQFTLYNNSAGTGSPVAGPVTTNGVIITNGLFTVMLDFGSSAWNGQMNWLLIAVETNGASSFTNLRPLQEMTPAPYAIFAESANSLVGPGQTSGSVDNNQNTITLGNGTAITNTLTGGSVVIVTNASNGILSLSAPDIPFTNALYFDHYQVFYANVSNADYYIGGATGPFDYASQVPPGVPYTYFIPSVFANQTGMYNFCAGYAAGQDLKSGGNNILIGQTVGFQIESGNGNVAIGGDGTMGNQNLASLENTIIGDNSWGNNYSINCVAIGAFINLNGNNNTNLIAVGAGSGGNLNTNESYDILVDDLGMAGSNNIISIGWNPASGKTYRNSYIGGDLHANANGITNVPLSALNESIGIYNTSGIQSAQYITSQSTYVVITNFSYSYLANATGLPLSGLMTNSIAGNFALSASISLSDLHSSGDSFQMQIFTNGIACGPSCYNDQDATLRTEVSCLVLSLPDFYVPLPANTEIALEVENLNSPFGFKIRNAALEMKNLP